MTRTAVTYCRICTALCGLLVEVDDDANRVVHVRGDADHVTSGGFTCVKGRRIGELTAHPTRFVTARVRAADGRLVPADTDTATEAAARRLAAIVGEHGPESVGMWFGTQSQTGLALPVALALLAALGSHKLFSPRTVDQAPKWAVPGRLGKWLGGTQRFEDSDVWLFSGYNPAVSMIGGWLTGFPQQNAVRKLRDAQQRGLTLIVVDPRRTETAALADIHLQLRPGTDAVLYAGMLGVILGEGLEDAEFCAQWVGDLETLRDAVAGATPEFVAAVTGVAAVDLVRATRAFATARKGMISTGTGPSMGPWGNLAEHLAACINTVCGRWARAGDIAFPPPVMRPDPGARAQVSAPDRPWERAFRSRVRGGIRAFDGELPAVALVDEIVEPGADRLRALIVVGGNPAAAIPDLDRTAAALRQLDLLICLDPFPSDTVLLADFVLPPVMALEREEHTGMCERSVGSPYAQWTEPVLAAPPGVREDWQYLFAFARTLGITLDVFGRPFAPDAPTPTAHELLTMSAGLGRADPAEVRAHPHGWSAEQLPPVRVLPPDDSSARFVLLAPDVVDELRAALAEPMPAAAPGEFRLIVRRAKDTSNSTGRWTVSDRNYNPCHLNPLDLERLGAVDGDVLRLTTAHGSVLAVAAADRSVAAGCVSMTHGYGRPGGADATTHGVNPNRLISATTGTQPINLMPQLTALPVTVELARSQGEVVSNTSNEPGHRPVTTMDCGCVFETSPEGQTVWNNHLSVCDKHADYPDFDAFKAALKTEHEPDSRAVIAKYNERFDAELKASFANMPPAIPLRGSLLLTTEGAKSKLARTVPLSFQRDGRTFILVGSSGGRDRNPDWYYNIRANPDVSFEVGGRTFAARAVVARGAERERLKEHSKQVRPVHVEFFARAEASIPREIPIVVLHPVEQDFEVDDTPLD